MTQHSQPAQSSQFTNGIHHARIIAKVDRLLPHLEKAVRQFNGEADSNGDMIPVDAAIASVRSAYELARDLRDFLTPDP